MCEWICLQGPGFKLTFRPHLFLDGFWWDIMGWENKHSHRNLSGCDGLASEANPPYLNNKCTVFGATRYKTMTYVPI